MMLEAEHPVAAPISRGGTNPPRFSPVPQSVTGAANFKDKLFDIFAKSGLFKDLHNHYQEFMVSDLKKSGIPIEVALKYKFAPVTQAEAEGYLGFKLPLNSGGGYTIPFHDPATGKPTTFPIGGGLRNFVRVKFEKPVQLSDHEKPAKYLSPKDGGMHIFTPELTRQILLANSRIPVFLTEGEKKALKADLEGIPCLGLCGIWGWVRGAGDQRLNIELEEYMCKGREVYMVYDSGANETPEKKKNFQECAQSLSNALFEYDVPLFRIDMPNLGGAL